MDSLIHFIETSPTAYHATQELSRQLEAAGFVRLEEGSRWHLSPGSKYYVVRYSSALAAFILPNEGKISALQMAASHLDSPALKLKPYPLYWKENMLLCSVEPYGSPLLSSWLNRDLGLAGRLFIEKENGSVVEQLIALQEEPFTLPQLAIHLDREVNVKGLIVDKQEQLSALVRLAPPSDERSSDLRQLLSAYLAPTDKLLSHDLFLYPIEKPRLIGSQGELLAAYRLDSLSSVHAIVQPILRQEASQETLKLALFWDHEEIGSESTQGAASPFCTELLERIALALSIDREGLLVAKARSLCLSVDLAHARHPHHENRHEPRHPLLFGHGVVIKHSVQQRYASEARGIAQLIALARRHAIPYQETISRADLPSGSTIGPIHATSSAIPTVDIGIAQLSMHSTRELIACQDQHLLERLIDGFWCSSPAL